MKTSALLASSLSLLAVAFTGCFNEPEPAYKTVPAEARVYLNDRALKDLSSCHDAFKAGEGIDYVNLDRNQLERFPAELATLKGLKWLRLNDNRLTSLPDLKALVKLRRIYLRNNRLKAVPETLKDLPTLTDIDLSGNPIETVPQWLADKPGLKNISLSRTNIRKLPENLEAWKTLQVLQLGDLNLSPEEMARLRKLLPDVAIVF